VRDVRTAGNRRTKPDAPRAAAPSRGKNGSGQAALPARFRVGRVERPEPATGARSSSLVSYPAAPARARGRRALVMGTSSVRFRHCRSPLCFARVVVPEPRQGSPPAARERPAGAGSNRAPPARVRRSSPRAGAMPRGAGMTWREVVRWRRQAERGAGRRPADGLSRPGYTKEPRG
jgi:hypothetical protein